MERLIAAFVRSRARRRRAGSILAAVACVALARTATAQTWRPEPGKNPSPNAAQIAEAKARYEKGVRLYEEEGSVQAALAEFERAYDLAPNYKVLYNIGQGARTLRDYASALRAFEAYLEGGQDKLPKPRVAEVQREIAQLRTYVATLTVQVDVDGATIALDNMNVGVSPLAKPLLVNAGRSTITATKAGRVGTVSVTLAGGDVQTARIELPGAVPPTSEPPKNEVLAPAPATNTTTTTASPLPASPLPRPTRTLPYLAFGIGATLGVAAGVTGFAALRSSRDMEETKFAGLTPSREAEALRTRTQRLSVASDVLTGAAIVSAAVGVVLLVVEPAQPPAATNAARAHRLKLFATPTGAGVTGVF